MGISTFKVLATTNPDESSNPGSHHAECEFCGHAYLTPFPYTSGLPVVDGDPRCPGCNIPQFVSESELRKIRVDREMTAAISDRGPNRNAIGARMRSVFPDITEKEMKASWSRVRQTHPVLQGGDYAPDGESISWEAATKRASRVYRLVHDAVQRGAELWPFIDSRGFLKVGKMGQAVYEVRRAACGGDPDKVANPTEWAHNEEIAQAIQTYYEEHPDEIPDSDGWDTERQRLAERTVPETYTVPDVLTVPVTTIEKVPQAETVWDDYGSRRKQ